ncbi:MAG TPA: hypothetical protein VF807_03255 [Ktedonobacterales bacterium]
MASPNWPHSDAAVANNGIEQVLDWYATRGGNLLGARRWEHSPLVLTHVRWLGPRGESLESAREPQDDARLTQRERDVWVELAVIFSSVHPATPSTEPLWLPLTISQPRAIELIEVLRQDSRSSGSSKGNGFSPKPLGYAGLSDPVSIPTLMPGFHDAPTQTSLPPLPRMGFSASDPAVSSPVYGDHGATVLACIEVELPISALGPAGHAASADFARDVAVNFSRAARALPQVHEVRGWMHSGRLVLAARMVMASESRAASRAETENALGVLRDALMARTIPYSKLMLADPGEWMQQGQVLSL